MPTSRKPTPWVPERADMIYIQHSPQAGDEIPGEHPMLVMSTRAFNERTGIVLGFPMTHAEFHADNPFAIAVTGPDRRRGFVLAFQPKSFDWQARAARLHPWGSGHTKVLRSALELLGDIVGMTASR